MTFLAHKDWAAQVTGIEGQDCVVTFSMARNDAGWTYSDGKLHLPSGLYEAQLSMNVIGSTDGNKLYGCIRENGVPERYRLLEAHPGNGNATSTFAGVSGMFQTAGGFYEPIFHHSAGVGSRKIGGFPFETWFSVRRIGDYVDPMQDGSYGHLAEVAAGSYCYVDRGIVLRPGVAVARIGFLTFSTGTYPLKIVRRNSAGQYDVVLSMNVSHGGSGFETFPVTWTTPSDGKDYHIGVYTAGVNQRMFDQTPRAYAGWDISGNGVTLTEQDALAARYVIGVRAVY